MFERSGRPWNCRPRPVLLEPDSSLLAGTVTQGLILFSTYPLAVVDGWARFVLFTYLSAAVVDAVPASLVRSST